MSRPKKTIPVWDLFHDLQRALLKAENVERQRTLCWVIEDVLAKTDNYKGFQFVDENGDRLYKPEDMHRTDPGGDCYYRRVYYGGES